MAAPPDLLFLLVALSSAGAPGSNAHIHLQHLPLLTSGQPMGPVTSVAPGVLTPLLLSSPSPPLVWVSLLLAEAIGHPLLPLIVFSVFVPLVHCSFCCQVYPPTDVVLQAQSLHLQLPHQLRSACSEPPLHTRWFRSSEWDPEVCVG